MSKSLFIDIVNFEGAYEQGDSFPPASGPALLASSLAWAARNKIPFEKVIPTLTDYGVPNFAYIGGKDWNKALWLTYADLLIGLPLGLALRRRMKRHLPEYFLQAVEQSEKDGTLEKTLPHFARGLNFRAELRQMNYMAILLPVAEFWIICGVATMLVIFVCPKLMWIFSELLNGDKLPFVTKFLIEVGDYLSPTPLLVLLIVAALIGWLVFKRLFGFSVLFIIEEICVRLPLLRRLFMDKALLELCASMGAYTGAGRNVNEALAYSAASCSHPWLRSRLRSCKAKVERGMDWLDAWREMRLNMPFDEMLLRNAEARENISSGFNSLMDWHYRKSIRIAKRYALLLFVLIMAFNAFLVITIALGSFAPFAVIIDKLSAW